MNTNTEHEQMPDGERQAWAQVASICNYVAALEMDWDRLAELREKRKAGRYVVGVNMPGYMPDSDPVACETAEDARDYLHNSMIEDAEREAEPDGNNKAAEELRAAAAELAEQDAEQGAAEYGRTIGGLHYWLIFEPGKLADEDEAEELAELEEAAGDCESLEDAETRIDEDALSVEVRSGWVSQGEEMQAEEFRILLCTGGPHVEIVGELDHYGQASSARVLWRDWGTSGEIFGFSHSAVLAYCNRYLYA